MKMRHLLAACSVMIYSLSSCNFSIKVNDDDLNFSTRQCAFYNEYSGYSMKNSGKTFTTYFLNDGQLPYMDVSDFFTLLDGFYNISTFAISPSVFFNYETVTYYTVSGNERSVFNCKFNWQDNTISGDTYFFSSAVLSSSTTDYSSWRKAASYDLDSQGSYSLTFDLGKYGMEIYKYGDAVLVPFSILNLLFCSVNMYNIFFNGSEFHGYLYYLETTDQYKALKTGQWAMATADQEMRNFTYDFICFTMDYFYGIADYKDITSFEKYLQSLNVEEGIKSTSSSEYLKAYYELFIKGLDEGHTSILSFPLFYWSDSSFNSVNYYGQWRNEYRTVNTALKEYRNKYGISSSNPVKYYVDGDYSVAMLTLDSFTIATNDVIASGNAWENNKDTFEFFYHYLNEIKTTQLNLDELVIDLSMNGGGSVASMINSLGFFTDDSVPYAFKDKLSGRKMTVYYSVDTNKNDDYTDDKAWFDSKKVSVLVSNNTFSAANEFSKCIQKYFGATILGTNSGGGECAVLPIVLPDGTGIMISGPTNGAIKTSSGYLGLQDGAKADIELDYSEYYDLSAVATKLKEYREL